MASLSVKVSTEARDAFERWCEDHGETVSSMLRWFVERAPGYRRLEVRELHDPMVGPPVGWLVVEDGCYPTCALEDKQ